MLTSRVFGNLSLAKHFYRRNTKWSDCLLPSSRHWSTPNWTVLSLVTGRGCLGVRKRSAKCRLGFLKFGLCGLPNADTDADEDENIVCYSAVSRYTHGFLLSMDRRKLYEWQQFF